MPPLTPASSSTTDEVALAERQVQMQKALLARSLRRAGQSGERLARRIGVDVKPVLIAGAVVAGALVVAGIGVVALGRRRRQRGWLAPKEPSVLGNAARAAGFWLARLAARRLADEVTRRLAESVATAPDQV